MIKFPIHFTYNGVAYTGQVLKIQTPPIEFHFMDLEPLDRKIPNPLIFAIRKTEDGKDSFSYAIDGAFGFSFGSDTEYPLEFGAAIANAIINECEKRDIPLFS